ncbi:MAG TPA: Ig-like domain-containing protein, partial [Verrucomicrobiae bacterium]|nr:Ig-like domain-containing protein [Verrucomicrobiae bacterium]
LKGTPVEKFTPPDPPQTTKPALLGTAFEEQVKVNKLTGLRATDLTPPDLIEVRPNRVAHSILWFVDKDDPTGPPPTNPAQDPQFGNWEAAVTSWVTRTNWITATSTVPDASDTLYTDANRPSVTITNPSDGGTVASRLATIQTNPQTSRTITRVEAYIDDTLVGTSISAPWSVDARIPNGIEKGYHLLTVRAYDDIGLEGSVSENINLTADPDPSLSGITIVSPHNDETWSRQSFPKTIQANLENPDLYSRVDVSFVGSDGVKRLVGSVLSPADSTISMTASVGPPSGRYFVLVEATRKDNGQKDQGSLSITVTE